jgi:hypothetical protein
MLFVKSGQLIYLAKKSKRPLKTTDLTFAGRENDRLFFFKAKFPKGGTVYAQYLETYRTPPRSSHRQPPREKTLSGKPVSPTWPTMPKTGSSWPFSTLGRGFARLK